MWEFHGCARAVELGGGCGPLLTASRPLIGTNLQLTATQLTPTGGPGFGLLLLGTRVAPAIDLSSIGVQGCFLHVNPSGAIVLGSPHAAGSLSYAIAIPNSPRLKGVRVAAQMVALEPSSTPLFKSSNGFELYLGLN